RHTRLQGDWSSDVCSSDLNETANASVYASASVLASLSFGLSIAVGVALPIASAYSTPGIVFRWVESHWSNGNFELEPRHFSNTPSAFWSCAWWVDSWRYVSRKLRPSVAASKPTTSAGCPGSVFLSAGKNGSSLSPPLRLRPSWPPTFSLPSFKVNEMLIFFGSASAIE